MTLAVSLAMKRCLALLLLATLPLQGFAALVTHTFAGDNGHGSPLVKAHDGQQDAGVEDYFPPVLHDDSLSCCVIADFCYGSPALIARFNPTLGTGLATEPAPIAPYSFSSFAPESPERPPLAGL
jgi:hypothetical protein